MKKEEFVKKALENFIVNSRVVKTIVDGRMYRVPYHMICRHTLEGILDVFYDIYLREYYIKNAKYSIVVNGKTLFCNVDGITTHYDFASEKAADDFYNLTMEYNPDNVWNKLYTEWLHERS